MIGKQNLKSVMDMLLNDEVYFSLFNLIERYRNFQSTCTPDLLRNMSERLENITADYWKEYFGISFRSHLHSSMDNILTLSEYVSTHTTNFISVNGLVVHGNIIGTEICPLKDTNLDEIEYDFYFYLNNCSLSGNDDAELFQQSTLYNVYSPSELQEMVIRLINLPLHQNERLTLEPKVCYHQCYKFFDELLRGYS